MSEFRREQDVLLQAATDILETMFFATPERSPAPEPRPGALIAAELRFKGALSGGFRIHMEEACARSIAGNFAGVMDPSELAAETTVGVLCELANMVCGATLSRLQPAAIFNLGSPSPLPPDSPAQSGGVEQWLRLDEGLLWLQLYVENGP